jgi:hypothetical protein
VAAASASPPPCALCPPSTLPTSILTGSAASTTNSSGTNPFERSQQPPRLAHPCRTCCPRLDPQQQPAALGAPVPSLWGVGSPGCQLQQAPTARVVRQQQQQVGCSQHQGTAVQAAMGG